MPRTQFSPRFLAALVVLCLSGAAAATPPALEFSFYAGHPRSFEAGVQANEHSNVGMTSLNVLTRVGPMFAWSGNGPALSVAMWHNSLAAVSGASAPAGAGFTLGTGWRISYGGQIVTPDANNAYVIEDDGTTNAFTKSGSNWVAPTGVYDALTYNSSTGSKLTRKDQTYRRFDPASGRLIEEVDAHGNAVTLAYDSSDRISTLTDAAGRALTFSYDSSGRLSQIADPLSTPRTWGLAYNSDSRLATLTDAAGNTFAFTYTSAGGCGRWPTATAGPTPTAAERAASPSPTRRRSARSTSTSSGWARVITRRGSITSRTSTPSTPTAGPSNGCSSTPTRSASGACTASPTASARSATPNRSRGTRPTT